MAALSFLCMLEIVFDARYLMHMRLLNFLMIDNPLCQFLGQMYAPNALEERLAMGTLEGLLHREYVEGTDEEYETSGLTQSDCSFDRFGKVSFNHLMLHFEDAKCKAYSPHIETLCTPPRALA